MEPDVQHPDDEIMEALDGRLPEARRAAFLAHLASCARCQGTFDALGWARHHAGHAARPESPPGLLGAIRLSLQRADSSPRRARWLMAAVGLAALVLSGLLLLQEEAPPPLPAAAARDYQDYRAGRLRLDAPAHEAERLQAFFDAAGLAFRTRVFDLGMMGYRLLGGRVHDFGGRRSALIVYRRNGTDETVICLMYAGDPAELPLPSERREHDGITFSVHREGALTVVFWPEGGVMCVLVGAGDPEAVVQLAFAKAMKVAPALRAADPDHSRGRAIFRVNDPLWGRRRAGWRP